MAIIKKRDETDRMIDDYIDKLPGSDYGDYPLADKFAMMSDATALRIKNDQKRRYDEHIRRIDALKRRRARMLAQIDAAISDEELRAQECLSIISAVDLRNNLPFDEDVVVEVIEEDEAPRHYGIMCINNNRTYEEELARVLGGPVY